MINVVSSVYLPSVDTRYLWKVFYSNRKSGLKKSRQPRVAQSRTLKIRKRNHAADGENPWATEFAIRSTRPDFFFARTIDPDFTRMHRFLAPVRHFENSKKKGVLKNKPRGMITLTVSVWHWTTVSPRPTLCAIGRTLFFFFLTDFSNDGKVFCGHRGDALGCFATHRSRIEGALANDTFSFGNRGGGRKKIALRSVCIGGINTRIIRLWGGFFGESSRRKFRIVRTDEKGRNCEEEECFNLVIDDVYRCLHGFDYERDRWFISVTLSEYRLISGGSPLTWRTNFIACLLTFFSPSVIITLLPKKIVILPRYSRAACKREVVCYWFILISLWPR